MANERRTAALALAEDLLTDLELSRTSPADAVRKASRLARLLDDTDAMAWLQYEIAGYGSGPLDSARAAAARRSRRDVVDKETGKTSYWTGTLGKLRADVESARVQLGSAGDAAVSISSANPNQFLGVPPGNRSERTGLRARIMESEDLIQKILGAVHGYVAEKQTELRFGQAVEDAFGTVRDRVDAKIAAMVPDAAVKFAAAFEGAASTNPEHWANAASACRRLLKALADELRPPGPPVAGRAMTSDKYINRLIDWIATRPVDTGTMTSVITADLEDFGKRIDAFDDAGHKGAHAEVTQYEASRFIAGAYLLVGDLLQLSNVESTVEEPAAS